MNESEEVWADDIKMGIINICMRFQARRLDEITKGVKVAREEAQGWSSGLFPGMSKN